MVRRLQGLQGRDRGFLGRDRVVFLLFSYRGRGPPCVATTFHPLSWQCCDRGSLVTAERVEARG